jgi:hypothetical protein
MSRFFFWKTLGAWGGHGPPKTLPSYAPGFKNPTCLFNLGCGGPVTRGKPCKPSLSPSELHKNLGSLITKRKKKKKKNLITKMKNTRVLNFFFFFCKI